LRKTIAGCLSTSHAERDKGHELLAELGPAGRATAGAAFSDRLKDRDSFIVSEAAYSLGVLDAKQYKSLLCGLVETRSEADILGRTLTVLRGSLEKDDLRRIADWQSRFIASPPTGTRPERILKYLEDLSLYVGSKYQSDPPGAGPSPMPAAI
jgi:hypothetical protein